MRFNNSIKILAVVMTLGALFTACKDDKSYADLLNEEEHAVNWYLSGCRVAVDIPADSVFKTGPDAPYYKMDEEGQVYMQVRDPGNPASRPEKGETVYFRYKEKNIKNMWEGMETSWSGNGQDISLIATTFIFGNYTLTSSSKWGEGIQIPMKFLGYDSEVNLVIKSRKGFINYQSQCLPMLVNVKYFKAEF